MIMTRVLRHMKVSTIWHVVSGFTSSERPSKIVPFTCIPSLSSTVSLEFPLYTGNILLSERLEWNPRLSLLDFKIDKWQKLLKYDFRVIRIYAYQYFMGLFYRFNRRCSFQKCDIALWRKIFFTLSLDSRFADLTWTFLLIKKGCSFPFGGNILLLQIYSNFF